MTRNLAITNLVIQCLLIVATAAAFWLARRRRLKRHCLIMRVSVGVQIVTIAAIMAPALNTYITHWAGWSPFMVRMVVHHTLGVIVVLLFIYFNLALTGVVRAPRRLRPYMRTALGLWLVSLGLGIYLYWYIWQ
jgi:hypothetical protein